MDDKVYRSYVKLQRLTEEEIAAYTTRKRSRSSSVRKRPDRVKKQQAKNSLKDVSRVDFSLFEEYRRSRQSFLKKKDNKKSIKRKASESPEKINFVPYETELTNTLFLNQKIKNRASSKKPAIKSTVKKTKKKVHKRIIVDSDSDCSVENYGIIYCDDKSSVNITNSYQSIYNDRVPSTLPLQNYSHSYVTKGNIYPSLTSEIPSKEQDLLSALSFGTDDEFYDRMLKNKCIDDKKYSSLNQDDLLSLISPCSDKELSFKSVSNQTSNVLSAKSPSVKQSTMPLGAITENLPLESDTPLNAKTTSLSQIVDKMIINEGIFNQYDMVSKIIQEMDSDFVKRKKVLSFNVASTNSTTYVQSQPVITNPKNDTNSSFTAVVPKENKHGCENPKFSKKSEAEKSVVNQEEKRILSQNLDNCSKISTETVKDVCDTQYIVLDLVNTLLNKVTHSGNVRNRFTSPIKSPMKFYPRIKYCMRCKRRFQQREFENICSPCKCSLGKKYNSIKYQSLNVEGSKISGIVTVQKQNKDKTLNAKSKILKKLSLYDQRRLLYTNQNIKKVNKVNEKIKIEKKSKEKPIHLMPKKHDKLSEFESIITKNKEKGSKILNNTVFHNKSLKSEKLSNKFSDNKKFKNKLQNTSGESKKKKLKVKHKHKDQKKFGKVSIKHTPLIVKLNDNQTYKSDLNETNAIESSVESSESAALSKAVEESVISDAVVPASLHVKNEDVKQENSNTAKVESVGNIDADKELCSNDNHDECETKRDFTVKNIKRGLFLMTFPEPDKELDLSSNLGAKESDEADEPLKAKKISKKESNKKKKVSQKGNCAEDKTKNVTITSTNVTPEIGVTIKTDTKVGDGSSAVCSEKVEIVTSQSNVKPILPSVKIDEKSEKTVLKITGSIPIVPATKIFLIPQSTNFILTSYSNSNPQNNSLQTICIPSNNVQPSLVPVCQAAVSPLTSVLSNVSRVVQVSAGPLQSSSNNAVIIPVHNAQTVTPVITKTVLQTSNEITTDKKEAENTAQNVPVCTDLNSATTTATTIFTTTIASEVVKSASVDSAAVHVESGTLINSSESADAITSNFKSNSLPSTGSNSNLEAFAMECIKSKQSEVFYELDAISILSILDLSGEKNTADRLFYLLSREVTEVMELRNGYYNSIEEGFQKVALIRKKLEKIKSLQMAIELNKKYETYSRVIENILNQSANNASCTRHKVVENCTKELNQISLEQNLMLHKKIEAIAHPQCQFPVSNTSFSETMLNNSELSKTVTATVSHVKPENRSSCMLSKVIGVTTNINTNYIERLQSQITSLPAPTTTVYSQLSVTSVSGFGDDASSQNFVRSSPLPSSIHREMYSKTPNASNSLRMEDGRACSSEPPLSKNIAVNIKKEKLDFSELSSQCPSMNNNTSELQQSAPSNSLVNPPVLSSLATTSSSLGNNLVPVLNNAASTLSAIARLPSLNVQVSVLQPSVSAATTNVKQEKNANHALQCASQAPPQCTFPQNQYNVNTPVMSTNSYPNHMGGNTLQQSISNTNTRYQNIMPAQQQIMALQRIPPPNRTIQYTQSPALTNLLTSGQNIIPASVQMQGNINNPSFNVNRTLMIGNNQVGNSAVRVQPVVLPNMSSTRVQAPNQMKFPPPPYPLNNFPNPQQNTQQTATRANTLMAQYRPIAPHISNTVTPTYTTYAASGQNITVQSPDFNKVPESILSQMFCIVCEKPAKLRCKQCAKVAYCNGECAKYYWHKQHKMECRPTAGVT